MAGNMKNLRPPFTPEEARKYGRMGGKASAEAKRKRKSFQEQAQEFLHLPIDDKDIQEFTSLKDIKGKNLETMTAMLAVVTQKALAGDLQAMAFLRDSAGEKPVEKVEVNADMVKAHEDIQARIKALKARHADDEH